MKKYIGIVSYNTNEIYCVDADSYKQAEEKLRAFTTTMSESKDIKTLDRKTFTSEYHIVKI